MKITCQIAVGEIADCLHGKVSEAELVDRAERAIMEAEFEEAFRLTEGRQHLKGTRLPCRRLRSR